MQMLLSLTQNEWVEGEGLFALSIRKKKYLETFTIQQYLIIIEQASETKFKAKCQKGRNLSCFSIWKCYDIGCLTKCLTTGTNTHPSFRSYTGIHRPSLWQGLDTLTGEKGWSEGFCLCNHEAIAVMISCGTCYCIVKAGTKGWVLATFSDMFPFQIKMDKKQGCARQREDVRKQRTVRR